MLEICLHVFQLQIQGINILEIKISEVEMSFVSNHQETYVSLIIWPSFSDYTLREKCPYSEFLWSAFSLIWIEYEFGKIRISKARNTDNVSVVIIVKASSQNHPILGQCSIPKRPEDIRKGFIFWCFLGVWKWTIELNWVNPYLIFYVSIQT